ncbi:hypothetical protein F4824DRAFT_482658 [Ustulina deusta]|nr:hypothetical protein F4824DRAFT_482658 [Ustulina deusta]
MSSKYPVPKSALGLRSEPDQGGGQRLCQEVAQEQSRPKRGNNDQNNDRRTDVVQVKRPKITESDDDAPDITTEALLDLVSPSALKKICAKVLEDETAGAKLRQELLSCTRDILAHSRHEADKERGAIIDAADRAIEEMVEHAIMKTKYMCNCDDWPSTLSPLFRRIKALHNRGSPARGPEMAWKALIKVAAYCIHDWDDGELRISGFGERDCDEFHDEVDDLMLLICKAQKQNGKVEWLRNGRKEEIQNLQDIAKDDKDKPCTYRYLDTLEFLEEV